MKYAFQLSDYPNSNFEIETSIWTNRSKLWMDDDLLEQSKEKGKPFLIPTTDGNFVKAFSKPSFPEFVPILEINGQKNQVVKKLKLHEYIIGGLPIMLVFMGGLIGGIIGMIGALTNFSIFRKEGSEISKYIKVIGIIAVTYILYSYLIVLFLKLIN